MGGFGLILLTCVFWLQLGNFIHYMATFVSGFVVGFTAVWQLALVTLAVVPLIALIGIIHTTTLAKLSSKSQDALSQAGNIAEQVLIYGVLVLKLPLSLSLVLFFSLLRGRRPGIKKSLSNSDSDFLPETEMNGRRWCKSGPFSLMSENRKHCRPTRRHCAWRRESDTRQGSQRGWVWDPPISPSSAATPSCSGMEATSSGTTTPTEA